MTTITIRMRVTHQEGQYLGECLEYPVMTHGRTLEELAENMERAILLFLDEQEEEDPFEEVAVMAVRVELPDIL